jgi:hypothetical protein
VTLPIEAHHKVVTDDACDDLPLTRIEAEALQDLVGDRNAPFGVAFDAAGLGDIVQEENRIEQRRGLGAEDDGTIALIDVRLAGVNRIQLH